MLFDYLELKYLRGWNPKQQGEFNVVVRLLVTRMFLTVEKKRVVNFREVKIKINNAVIRNKVEDNSAVLVDSDFSLSTSKRQNKYRYCDISMGFVCGDAPNKKRRPCLASDLRTLPSPPKLQPWARWKRLIYVIINSFHSQRQRKTLITLRNIYVESKWNMLAIEIEINDSSAQEKKNGYK